MAKTKKGKKSKSAGTTEENEWYSVGEWSNLPNYECKHCAYSTTDLHLIKTHVIRHMDPVIKTVKTESTVLGADNKPIVRETTVLAAPEYEGSEK